ncbi:unnamed protein product [Cunninghamella blakesleeana]
MMISLLIASGFIQMTLAATGKLYVNGVEIMNPIGCIAVNPIPFSVGRAPEIDIVNHLDKMVKLHHHEHCQGEMNQIIEGTSFTTPFGKAIFVE